MICCWISSVVVSRCLISETLWMLWFITGLLKLIDEKMPNLAYYAICVFIWFCDGLDHSSLNATADRTVKFMHWLYGLSLIHSQLRLFAAGGCSDTPEGFMTLPMWSVQLKDIDWWRYWPQRTWLVSSSTTHAHSLHCRPWYGLCSGDIVTRHRWFWPSQGISVWCKWFYSSLAFFRMHIVSRSVPAHTKRTTKSYHMLNRGKVIHGTTWNPSSLQWVPTVWTSRRRREPGNI